MSQLEVYQEIQDYLGQYLRPGIGKRTLDRLTLLVSGMLKARHGAPAQIAEAGKGLSARGAQAESIERRIRRIENDARVQPQTCLEPLVKKLLANSRMEEMRLIVDPSLQEDRVVLVSINAWYRGRSLPLAWSVWPANRPLEGAGFWQRIAELLHRAQQLIPPGVRVTVLADRAFGTPAFTDLVTGLGWHWIVRVQGQTQGRDICGRERSLAQRVKARGERAKLAGQVFKKAGWRTASMVVYWGQRYTAPLCLVSDLPPAWTLIADYRRRFAIEPSFRDWKSYGWRWEQGQVTNLEHLKRLLLGMALATWLTLLVGALHAQSLLAQLASGKRHTRPWAGKKSLFRLGLQLWFDCFSEGLPPRLAYSLPDWNAPNWSTQITAHFAYAFIFA